MAHFSIPSHIIIGKNALEEAKIYLKKMGNRAFIVTGKHIAKSPMINQLKKVLDEENIAYYVFDGITGEPTDKMIEEGAKLYKKYTCQFCIGIGGGSPIDSAKAIAVLAINKGKISNFNGKEITGPVSPIVAIPTTSGTGSEATRFTAIIDKEKDIKMLLKGDCLVPDIAIVDFDFSVDMPKSITASTGLDALTHALEAYTSKKAFLLTDVYAVSAVKRIVKYLPVAYKNGYNAKAREQMAIAALESGVCINNSSVTIVHEMSRPISSLFHVPHGMSNAMILKECMRFAVDGAYDRFAELGRAIGEASQDDSDKEASEKLILKVEEVCRTCEIPTLRQYGIKEAEFMSYIPKMAEDVMLSGGVGNTRKNITKEDCMKIYRKIYLT